MKDQEDVKMQRRAEMIRDRVERARKDTRLPLVGDVASERRALSEGAAETIAGED